MSKARLEPEPQRPNLKPPCHNDEYDLMARVSNGDPAALEVLYDRYAAAVCTLAMRIVVNRDEAEEITLETFSLLWRQAPRFDPVRNSLRTWLFMMTRNRALAGLRSRGSNAAARPAGDDPALADSPEQRQVRCALAELPASHREALELAYFSGLSYAEIARRTGEPPEVIKASIAQALMKLRTLLATLEV